MVHLQLQRYTEEKLTESKIHVILSTSFADDASLVLDQIKVYTDVTIISTFHMTLLHKQNFNARIIVAWVPHSAAVQFWCTVSL